MILNEDFFDDIEIKDDELKTDSESGLYTDVNKDAKTLLNDMLSSYKQCLRFEFSTPFDENTHSWNLYDKTNKWNLFRNTIRRVCRVFDAYGIKYSEPLFCTTHDWYDIRHKEFDKNWNIIDIENNKMFVNTDNIESYKNLSPKNELTVLMFIDDFPVFNSAKSAYRFLYRFANNLQQNMIHNNLYDVRVLDIKKDNRKQDYVINNRIKTKLNSTHINAIIKPIMWWIKDDILYLLSPQYKYRQEFEKASTERELLDLIKNH